MITSKETHRSSPSIRPPRSPGRAVPIYGIGTGIKATQVDVRYKFGRFCSETGGNVYSIDRAEDLHRIYTDIQNELRSQYILGFYPPEGVKPGSKWHEITVQVSEGKTKDVKGVLSVVGYATAMSSRGILAVDRGAMDTE